MVYGIILSQDDSGKISKKPWRANRLPKGKILGGDALLVDLSTGKKELTIEQANKYAFKTRELRQDYWKFLQQRLILSKRSTAPPSDDRETREDDLDQELKQVLIFVVKGRNQFGIKEAERSDDRTFVGKKEFEMARNGAYTRDDLLNKFQFLDEDSIKKFFKAFKAGEKKKEVSTK